MTLRKLIICDGADRVGKSTLIAEIQKHLGEENCDTTHLSEPPNDQDGPYDINLKKVLDWVATGKEWFFFDRSYPCSMVYEERRRGNAGHLLHVVEHEIELADHSDEFQVVHVCVEKSWQWSAKHHLAEVRQLFPEAAPWFVRDQMISRMHEHKEYYKKMDDFYESITMFPTVYFFEGGTIPTLFKDIHKCLSN